MLPVILTVAGSDPSGGAGIQADLSTIAALGGYGTSAVAAITVQNSQEFRCARPVEPDLVRDQIDAIFKDMPVAAVKTGMLVDADVIVAVARVLGAAGPVRIVVDPVMAATTGGASMDDDGVAAIRQHLMPLATLMTPNVPEAERLTGCKVRTVEDGIRASRMLLGLGARAVLLKGGHLAASPGTDVLVTGETEEVLPGVWQDQPHSHGTGCVLSAAIATYLGLGDDLGPAVRRGRTFLARALAHGRAPGGGPGSVNPLFRLVDEEGSKEP
ncbi:MAG: bifunctional hydroxymethylpyrimidine kinase/phosphomethylpyrimidine kinase [Acidobacteria bacterium]|uniref:hydroxymethylpyrimidine kinase n=1 Tax=Candidatus Polarisedimenticola svalbardensis TaxID=2886004 RepID=A0A8J7CF92_9BACT|nr:bifunctional hydroxymethylpyrimidine kinase/phosphomethylpyrimidine kinase [Candidatus Polarisedimenticola svalbardensis]